MRSFVRSVCGAISRMRPLTLVIGALLGLALGLWWLECYEYDRDLDNDVKQAQIHRER